MMEMTSTLFFIIQSEWNCAYAAGTYVASTLIKWYVNSANRRFLHRNTPAHQRSCISRLKVVDGWLKEIDS